MSQENITPIHERMLGRDRKQELLGQRGKVVWMYGLSGSGKSTIALELEQQLHDQGRYVVILDGDNVRSALNGDLGFGDEARKENIRRVAHVARLFVQNGAIVLCSFICPKRELRQMAREIVGGEDFEEVFVSASYEACMERDPKGLYAKVKAGQVKQFTGKDSGFECPHGEDDVLVVETEQCSVEEAVALLRERVFGQG